VQVVRFIRETRPYPEEPPEAGVSKDGPQGEVFAKINTVRIKMESSFAANRDDHVDSQDNKPI